MSKEYLSKNKFEYLDIGSGPNILLLHGLFGSLSNFEELIDKLKINFRVILPKLPLYTCDLNNANIDGLVEYVTEFIDFLNIKKTTLIGNSLGGHIALEYCLKYPKIVDNLVLTGSSGLFENSLGTSYPKKNKDFIREKVIQTFGKPHFATDDLVNDVYNIVIKRDYLLRIVSIAKSATRHNLQHKLNLIMCKTLLIWGDIDIVTPPFVAKQFEELIKYSELHFLENVGHAAMMEDPDNFYKLTLNFLTNNTK